MHNMIMFLNLRNRFEEIMGKSCSKIVRVGINEYIFLTESNFKLSKNSAESSFALYVQYTVESESAKLEPPQFPQDPSS